MLEIIALVILTKRIGLTAEQKGLKPGTWKLYTVLAWIGGEILGALAGFLLFDSENRFSIIILALAGAVTGYFIVKNILDKKSDDIQNEINNIGVNDLKP
jgi:uncharacterized membrane protein YeaQ/YmgE (transglycosylase-associated protein family)